jgi:adenine deaminase
MLGLEGIRFMLDNAGRSPLKIMFGAPPFVSETVFGASGAVSTVITFVMFRLSVSIAMENRIEALEGK